MGIADKLLPPADRDEFAKIIARAFEQAGWPDAQYDADAFQLTFPGPKQFFLANAYAAYCASKPWNRRRTIQQYVQTTTGAADAITPIEQARDGLLPCIRGRMYWESARLSFLIQGNEDGARWIVEGFQVLADHLTVAVMTDTEHAIKMHTATTLAEWDLTLNDALAIARENLWRASNENFLNLQEGLYLAPWNDGYATSRMYLHDLIWQLDVKGRHVVMIPNANRLLVTGSEDEQGLEAMAQASNKILESEQGEITRLAFTLVDGQWQPFLPDPAMPAFTSFKLLETQEYVRSYEEQKKLLEALNAKRQEDCFVASIIATQNSDTKEISSFAVWSKGVQTLLPRTRLIAFMIPADDDQFCVPWHDACQICGDLMTPTDHYPARFRVSRFPSDEQIQALRKCAIAGPIGQ